MADDPLLGARVVYRDKTLNKLVSYYKGASEKIVKELESTTDFGVANRKKVLRRIDTILQDLDEKTAEWYDKEIKKYYQDGLDSAQAHLAKYDFPITEGFTSIDTQAIKALAEGATDYYRDAYGGVKRGVMSMFNEATKERLKAIFAEGKISGDTKKSIAGNILTQLRSQGLVAFTDRGGRKWALDSYSNMLTRTWLVRTVNEGLTNRLTNDGYELVEVSDHFGECELCRPWEGQILSLSGRHPKYQTREDAEGAGLFHPNCRHRYIPYHEALQEVSYAWNPSKQRYIKL